MSMLPVYRVPVRLASKFSAPTTTPTFESCLHTLELDIPEQRRATRVTPVDYPIIAAPPSGEVIDPATSERNGSITRDKKRRSPTHEWNSLDEFQTWRTQQELEHGIELLLVRTYSAGSPLWHEKRVYFCSRQGTGGKSNYIRKRVDRIRSRPSKRTGCRCRVIVKTYHHVPTVLGWYRAEHDHATGVANLRFTRLQDSTRAYVSSLLRRQMKPREILTRVRSEHSEHERGHYITMSDIYRIRRTIKQEEARTISREQPSYEHPEGNPVKDEELVASLEGVNETESSQEDEDPEVPDEQSNGCADPGIPISPPSEPAHPQVYTPPAGVTPSEEPTALSVMPANQVSQNFAPPVFPPHDVSVPYYTPPPLVVYMPHPPYQMTLYPVYPVFFPPPAM